MPTQTTDRRDFEKQLAQNACLEEMASGVDETKRNSSAKEVNPAGVT
ncbi:MAG: hypothetical protein U0872_02140 [Planctomycetaceae bacterium]